MDTTTTTTTTLASRQSVGYLDFLPNAGYEQLIHFGPCVEMAQKDAKFLYWGTTLVTTTAEGSGGNQLPTWAKQPGFSVVENISQRMYIVHVGGEACEPALVCPGPFPAVFSDAESLSVEVQKRQDKESIPWYHLYLDGNARTRVVKPLMQLINHPGVDRVELVVSLYPMQTVLPVFCKEDYYKLAEEKLREER